MTMCDTACQLCPTCPQPADPKFHIFIDHYCQICGDEETKAIPKKEDKNFQCRKCWNRKIHTEHKKGEHNVIEAVSYMEEYVIPDTAPDFKDNQILHQRIKDFTTSSKNAFSKRLEFVRFMEENICSTEMWSDYAEMEGLMKKFMDLIADLQELFNNREVQLFRHRLRDYNEFPKALERLHYLTEVDDTYFI